MPTCSVGTARRRRGAVERLDDCCAICREKMEPVNGTAAAVQARAPIRRPPPPFLPPLHPSAARAPLTESHALLLLAQSSDDHTPLGDPHLPPRAQSTASNRVPQVLPCGHIFHYRCLRAWLEQSLSQVPHPAARRASADAHTRACRPGASLAAAAASAGDSGLRRRRRRRRRRAAPARSRLLVGGLMWARRRAAAARHRGRRRLTAARRVPRGATRTTSTGRRRGEEGEGEGEEEEGEEGEEERRRRASWLALLLRALAAPAWFPRLHLEVIRQPSRARRLAAARPRAAAADECASCTSSFRSSGDGLALRRALLRHHTLEGAVEQLLGDVECERGACVLQALSIERELFTLRRRTIAGTRRATQASAAADPPFFDASGKNEPLHSRRLRRSTFARSPHCATSAVTALHGRSVAFKPRAPTRRAPSRWTPSGRCSIRRLLRTLIECGLVKKNVRSSARSRGRGVPPPPTPAPTWAMILHLSPSELGRRRFDTGHLDARGAAAASPRWGWRRSSAFSIALHGLTYSCAPRTSVATIMCACVSAQRLGATSCAMPVALTCSRRSAPPSTASRTPRAAGAARRHQVHRRPPPGIRDALWRRRRRTRWSTTTCASWSAQNPKPTSRPRSTGRSTRHDLDDHRRPAGDRRRPSRSTRRSKSAVRVPRHRVVLVSSGSSQRAPRPPRSARAIACR